MAALHELKCNWSGGAVNGSASSTFYTDTVHLARALTNITAFWSALRTALPAGVQITTPSTGKVFDDVTGLPQGDWQSPNGASTFASADSKAASPAGALLKLETGVLVGRRRLRGHIFIVPLSHVCYGTDGGVDPGYQSQITAAAANLISGDGDFVLKLWHRPKAGAGGSSSYINSASCSAKVAVLKSRRD